MMGDANGVEEGIEPFKIATPINLHRDNFMIKHSFN
jgi:hypothetical protein